MVVSGLALGKMVRAAVRSRWARAPGCSSSAGISCRVRIESANPESWPVPVSGWLSSVSAQFWPKTESESSVGFWIAGFGAWGGSVAGGVGEGPRWVSNKLGSVVVLVVCGCGTPSCVGVGAGVSGVGVPVFSGAASSDGCVLACGGFCGPAGGVTRVGLLVVDVRLRGLGKPLPVPPRVGWKAVWGVGCCSGVSVGALPDGW